MRREPRVVLLTGSERRHRYAAAALDQHADVVGIVSEARANPSASPALSPEDRKTIECHLAERDVVESTLLGEPPAFPVKTLLQSPRGGVNRLEVVDWIRQRRPDIVVLFGASIISPSLLDLFPGRIVNVHLGLSPYYRGSATNFWPLVERKPECVGATIHLAVAKVDAGPILGQVRPNVDVCDRGHDLGTKAILAAFHALPLVLLHYHGNRLAPHAQRLAEGRVFRGAAFNAAAVRELSANIEGGMMSEYVRDAEARCRVYPIVPVPMEE